MQYLRKVLYTIVYRIRTIYKSVMALPIWLRYPIAGVLIIVGAINLVNPLINGMLLIAAGLGLISTTGYKHIRKRRHRYRSNHHRSIKGELKPGSPS